MRKKIFERAEQGSWHRNAVIGGHISGWDYVLSYKEAADMLIDAALAQRLPDFAFIPACQLYRHAIELALKSLILDADRLIGYRIKAGEVNEIHARERREVLKRLESTHGLHPLLNELIERLSFVSKEVMEGSVTRAVTQLHAIDPSGQAFRYATKKGSEDLHLPEQRHYDLLRVKQELGKAITFLSYGVGGWLDAEIENARDYLEFLDSAADDFT